jgi:hypothetical protein
LSCAFLKKNKHNLRINISVTYKIVINSPEVCFGIRRQYTKVGCKNLTIISYKNHLCRFCRNGKPFLFKDLQHNIVQFLAQQLAKT